jgi:hypothetical protein
MARLPTRRGSQVAPVVESGENGSLMANAASSKLTPWLRRVARGPGMVPLEIAVHDRRHDASACRQPADG